MTHQKGKFLRHPVCLGYGDEITLEKFTELNSTPPPTSEPTTPTPPEPKSEKNNLVEIQLEDERDVLDTPPETPTISTPETKELEKPPLTDNILGAGLCLGLNLAYRFARKPPLSDTEKTAIKDSSLKVAAKYPDTIAALPYGAEMELAETVSTTVFSRWKLPALPASESSAEKTRDDETAKTPN